MSEVYKGKDLHLDRDIVLKCLQPFQEQQRIIDEQVALQEVVSKHVVQLLDVVRENIDGVDRTFLVIEYIDGNDLEEFSMDYNQDYLQKLWQVASGLSQIHGATVIHRDIKPGNIRIDQEGVAKIFDFGLARQQGVNNQTKGAIGTPLYIAPEMLVDKTIDFTTAADVFAFGVTALTLLKRSPPASTKQLFRIIPDNAVSIHAPEFPESVSHLLQSCLADEPNARPTMERVSAELARVLLKDKHTAQLVLGGMVSNIDKDRRYGFPKVEVTATGQIVSGLQIHYDGDDFIVIENVGNVLANNMLIAAGAKLMPSCVLAFPRLNSTVPYYATFNVNQPEVLV
ncbi:MAG: serine/threonine-protein kinase [Pseudomonadota bacterium]